MLTWFAWGGRSMNVQRSITCMDVNNPPSAIWYNIVFSSVCLVARCNDGVYVITWPSFMFLFDKKKSRCSSPNYICQYSSVPSPHSQYSSECGTVFTQRWTNVTYAGLSGSWWPGVAIVTNLVWFVLRSHIPRKHKILTHCWVNIGPASQTVDRHWSNYGSTSCVCRVTKAGHTLLLSNLIHIEENVLVF